MGLARRPALRTHSFGSTRRTGLPPAPGAILHRTAIYLIISECDIIAPGLASVLRGVIARASAGGKEGEANEIHGRKCIPAQTLKARLQRMWQALQRDNLRSLRDEDSSGRAGQKNVRRKWRLLGEMGIARRYSQTPALSPASLPAGAALFTGFVKGAGFSSRAELAAGQERTNRNRRAGKRESWIRKPAPLNTASGRHP
jgi:hypothetical protein